MTKELVENLKWKNGKHKKKKQKLYAREVKVKKEKEHIRNVSFPDKCLLPL